MEVNDRTYADDPLVEDEQRKKIALGRNQNFPAAWEKADRIGQVNAAFSRQPDRRCWLETKLGVTGVADNDPRADELVPLVRIDIPASRRQRRRTLDHIGCELLDKRILSSCGRVIAELRAGNRRAITRDANRRRRIGGGDHEHCCSNRHPRFHDSFKMTRFSPVAVFHNTRSCEAFEQSRTDPCPKYDGRRPSSLRTTTPRSISTTAA